MEGAVCRAESHLLEEFLWLMILALFYVSLAKVIKDKHKTSKSRKSFELQHVPLVRSEGLYKEMLRALPARYLVNIGLPDAPSCFWRISWMFSWPSLLTRQCVTLEDTWFDLIASAFISRWEKETAKNANLDISQLRASQCFSNTTMHPAFHLVLAFSFEALWWRL